MNQPIDAVITWVDGYDPIHKQKLQSYLKSIGNPNAPGAAPTRFNQLEEINYCVRSLLHFAPWLRNIFIVTDAQIPKIIHMLKTTHLADKVQLIDHKDIFLGFESYLPTFNSLSIESVLWRIPGLSEQFIYLNDDCVLVSPLFPEDFVRKEKLVLRGRWRSFFHRKLQNRITSIITGKPTAASYDLHRRIQENSAQLLGFDSKFFHLPHCPFILQKKTFADFFNHSPELLAKNVSHPLRELDQFWAISLAMHLEIINKNYIYERDDRSVAVNPACHSLKKIQHRLENSPKNTAFVCLQSLDAGDESTQRWLFDWLDKKIPPLESLRCKG